MPHEAMISATACAVALILWHHQTSAELVNPADARGSAFDEVNAEEHSRPKNCLLQSSSSLGMGNYLNEAADEFRKPRRHGSSGEQHLQRETSQLSKTAAVKSAARGGSSRANATAVPKEVEYADVEEADESSNDGEVSPDPDVIMEVSASKQVPVPSPSPTKNGTVTGSSKDKTEESDDVEEGEDDPLEPDHESCNPACTWKCATPSCDQNCEPTCMPPKCETRCAALNTSGCMMDCQEPTCYTVCPKSMCAGKKCPVCKTTCTKPLCRLKCPQRQNCKSICATPSCEWHCSKPAICPAPKCKLECEQPTKCKGGIHKKLPDLKEGEFKVGSFEAPLNVYPNTGSGGCGCSVPMTTPCTCDEERQKVTDADGKGWEVVSNTGDSGSGGDGFYYSGAEAGTPVTMPVTVERSAEQAGYPQSHQVHMPVLAQRAASVVRRSREEAGLESEPA
mmetsp:Transcript_110467/g.195485  ORF Transcript_110467/g.195485 Transcript_110467/m.195485 type:complete len:451 (+) Transcript_110467:44-1396(+)